MNQAIEAFAERFDSDVDAKDVGHWTFSEYRDAARATLEASRNGAAWLLPVAAAICPGNGTSYGMILTPLGIVQVMDEWSESNVLRSHGTESVLLSMPQWRGHGAWAFRPGYTDVEYVAEKLSFSPRSPDALVIAAFLNALWAEMNAPWTETVVVRVQ